MTTGVNYMFVMILTPQGLSPQYLKLVPTGQNLQNVHSTIPSARRVGHFVENISGSIVMVQFQALPFSLSKAPRSSPLLSRRSNSWLKARNIGMRQYLDD